MAKVVKENVNHPSHYNQGGVECIVALRSALGEEGFRGFCAGNVIKYIWRYQHKNGLEDCEKAKFYLDWLIEDLAENANKNSQI